MVIENTENRLKEMRRIGWDIATTRSRWLDCLHACFNRYPDIVENFSSHFVYGLSRNPRIKGECLTQCLEMLQGATNHLRKNVINGSEVVCGSDEIHVKGMTRLDLFEIGLSKS